MTCPGFGITLQNLCQLMFPKIVITQKYILLIMFSVEKTCVHPHFAHLQCKKVVNFSNRISLLIPNLVSFCRKLAILFCYRQLTDDSASCQTEKSKVRQLDVRK